MKFDPVANEGLYSVLRFIEQAHKLSMAGQNKQAANIARYALARWSVIDTAQNNLIEMLGKQNNDPGT